jgi:hypothetical protein
MTNGGIIGPNNPISKISSNGIWRLEEQYNAQKNKLWPDLPVVSGLHAWYDPSVTSSITSSAGKVSKLDDLSGNARHLLQLTGSAQPSTGVNTQNGLNVITHSSSVLDSTISITSNALTVFAVALKTNAGSAAHAYSRWASFWLNTGNDYGDTNGACAFYSTQSFDGFAPSAVAYRNSATFQSFALTYNVPNISGFRINGTATTNYHNLASKTSTTSATLMNSNRFSSGSSYGVITDSALNGWIGETIIYNRAISDTEATIVQNYLKTKWAV